MPFFQENAFTNYRTLVIFLFRQKNKLNNIVLKYCKPNTNIELVF